MRALKPVKSTDMQSQNRSFPGLLGRRGHGTLSTAVAFLSSRHRRDLLLAIVFHLVLIAGAITMLVPFFWMISTSLKDNAYVLLFPPQWIPNPIRWENYPDTLTKLPFDRFFQNTTLITLTSTFGVLASCSVVAFSFARLRWWGRDAMFVLVLSTMMLPYQVTMIPQFVMFTTLLGWKNTFLPLIVPNFFGVAFYIFLMRQFFMTVSLELDDAARIDGASTFTIFSQIILPLSKPVLTAVAIFQVQASWNDFLAPLLYLDSEDRFTLSLGLQATQAQYHADWPGLMAASLVTMLPLVLLFFAGQKYFIQGVVFTGIKG